MGCFILLGSKQSRNFISTPNEHNHARSFFISTYIDVVLIHSEIEELHKAH